MPPHFFCIPHLHCCNLLSIANSMASYSFFAFLISIFFFLSVSNAQPSSSSRPGGLIFTVSRDPSTLQYVTNINLGNVSTKLVIDLAGSRSWIYSSKGCASTLISGVVTARSNDLKNGQWVSGPNVTARGISFDCETTTGGLRGLAKGASGILGLGRSGLSLASQFSTAFQFPLKFTLKLTSDDNGEMYFGDGPYTYLDQPFIHPFTYTPLIINSYFSSEYFVDLKSIEIGGVSVALNKGLLSINKNNGVGGTKFSPSVPYTTMETSIYKAFTNAYIQVTKTLGIYNSKTNKRMGISMVAPVAPFTACFNESTIERRIEGLIVPRIALGFGNANWYIEGLGNTLKYAKDNVYCLAFVDGGSNPKTSIVIGGYQMHYTIIEFDVEKSRLGISTPYQL